MRFADRIEAVGTARANEQVTLVRAGHRADRPAQFRRRQLRPARPGRSPCSQQAQESAAAERGPGARARGRSSSCGGSRRCKERGFATRADYDTQVAAAAAARAQAQQARARDRRAGDPRALLGLGVAAQHLGRRDRQPGHRDRDDQRHQHDQARFHRARDDAVARSGRACRSRRARPPIPTSRSAARSTPSIR